MGKINSNIKKRINFKLTIPTYSTPFFSVELL